MTGKRRVPLIVPIVSPPFYAFTAGLPKQVPGCSGEIVISRLGTTHNGKSFDPRYAADVIGLIHGQIHAGDLSPSEWTEGSVLHPTDLSCCLRVHILPKESLPKWLGSSLHPELEIPAVEKAFQLIWPDEQGRFTEDLVSYQQFLE